MPQSRLFRAAPGRFPIRISKTIARLAAARLSADAGNMAATDRLSDIRDFGANPGNLRARCYRPPGLAANAPLVVILHGCTQNAALYDQGSGWSALADRHGFALLYPEQKRANNSNLCFNWYQNEDARRGHGEAKSIAAMVQHMVAAHNLDPARVFVTGLSAGGAMASVMLAAYPDLFAAGAIVAGLPFGVADNLGRAFESMGGRGRGSSGALGDAVRKASSHRGPWPGVSVWHGNADHIVNASNGDDIAAQWRDVHGLSAKPDRVGTVDGYPHKVWLGPDGAPLVEQYVITGMGHGVPLAPGEGEGQSGEAGAHMLDAAISSTDRIAAFWGIADEAVAVRRPAAREPAREAPRGPVRNLVPIKAPIRRQARNPAPKPAPKPIVSGVQKIIEDALRTAGLMR